MEAEEEEEDVEVEEGKEEVEEGSMYKGSVEEVEEDVEVEEGDVEVVGGGRAAAAGRTKERKGGSGKRLQPP